MHRQIFDATRPERHGSPARGQNGPVGALEGALHALELAIAKRRVCVIALACRRERAAAFHG